MTIVPRGTKAELCGEIPPELENAIANEFSYMSGESASDIVWFYADGMMYRGIVEDVAAFCEKNGYECSIEYPDRPESTFRWEMLYTLREFQAPAVEAFLPRRQGFIKAPPGAGKTVVAAYVTVTIGGRTCIVVQNERPFRQMLKTFKQATTVQRVGQIGLGQKTIGDVTVCMVQSLSKEIEENPDGEVATWLRGVKLLIVDEAHHAASDSYLGVFDLCESADDVLGLSATPWRDDGRDMFLRPLIGPVLYEVPFGDLIDTGDLCPLTVIAEPVPPHDYGYSSNRHASMATKRKGYQVVYRDYVVEGRTGRNAMCAEFTKAMLEKGRTVAIVVSRVEHAQEIVRVVKGAVMLVASTPDRERILDELQHREIRCIVTTLMDEAVDIPSLDVVANIAGGRSSVKLEQRIRSTRSFDGELRTGHYRKERGYLWYPIDQTDFLRSQCRDMLNILRRIVKEHPEKNRLYMLEEWVPGG